MSKAILNRKQVSKLLDVSISTLNNWDRNGTLKAKRIGRRNYYLEQDIYDKLGIEA